MQEMWVQSLGGDNPLEKEMATTPVFLPEKFHGQRSLVGYSPWACKESNMTPSKQLVIGWVSWLLLFLLSPRRSNQSILKEVSPGCSLEGLMLKLKLQYFDHLMWSVDSLEKTLMLGGIGGLQEEKGTTQDEMAGWHHRLNGRESEWALGAGDGQGGLACCDSWGRKESDTTERLNWTEEV